MNKLLWWNAEARMLRLADNANTAGLHEIAAKARKLAAEYRQNAEKAA